MLRLSGDLPILGWSDRETACRSCAQKFRMLSLGNRCHHCGYHHCHDCSDNWAAWPVGNGEYKAKRVCCFCVEYLRVTASSGAQLESDRFSHDKLLQYVRAYNIEIPRNPENLLFIHKKEVIMAITALSKDGCMHLPLTNERYYRQHSVPNNAPNAQNAGSKSKSPSYHRPTGLMTWGQRNPWTPPPREPPHVGQTSSPVSQRLPPSLSSSSASQTRARTQPQPQPQTNSIPIQQQLTELLVPSLDELLDMPPQEIESLDDDILKSILESHQSGTLVSNRAGQRKTLMRLVFLLVEGERKERDRQLGFAEILEGAHGLRLLGSPALLRQGQEGEDARTAAMSAQIPHSGVTQAGVFDPSREIGPNLCVICQDEEANIAVITCGHMVMCKACSETVMDNSRQCPFCRIPIPTKSHLIRIYTS